MNASTASRPAQRGLTLVQLMVGLAVGLGVTAATGALLGSTLRDARGAQRDQRLMQDLRTAADVVSRDLRRAGHWGDAAAGVAGPGDTAVRSNPYTALSPDAAASDAASFRYSRDATENHAVDPNEQFGFRVRRGVLEMQLGNANWQALTDAGALTVTHFSVTPQAQTIDLQAQCQRPCPGGATACPPRLEVRSLALRLVARSATAPDVVRGLSHEVRLRNDRIVGACAA